MRADHARPVLKTAEPPVHVQAPPASAAGWEVLSAERSSYAEEARVVACLVLPEVRSSYDLVALCHASPAGLLAGDSLPQVFAELRVLRQ
mmetsp:Transcript_60773/g.144760  ORF Transcript_60773/g.144760 Transcript_60773/m.144760 type:complete len:90 (+) Transcript_60773:1137-1406(+)